MEIDSFSVHDLMRFIEKAIEIKEADERNEIVNKIVLLNMIHAEDPNEMCRDLNKILDNTSTEVSSDVFNPVAGGLS